MSSLSERLAAFVDALPLQPGLRDLEIGGAPGAAAKAVAHRIGAALTPAGRLFVDGGNPLREVDLSATEGR